jgi:DNA polymerase-4
MIQSGCNKTRESGDRSRKTEYFKQLNHREHREKLKNKKFRKFSPSPHPSPRGERGLFAEIERPNTPALQSKRYRTMQTIRKIIHIDMDAFYASIEQRDNPRLEGKPVIVGGTPDKRGVVAACSYEARKFGIHSAMSSSRAYKLCPEAVFIGPRFDVYRQVSVQIREIFSQYTDLVEPLSLDEAFLDVTVNKKGIGSGTFIAREIKGKILKKTTLTSSAGVSFNKFLSKVASDMNKPDGLTVITPEGADRFIDLLPIRKFFGIGKVTEKKMLEMNIQRGADLKKVDREMLIKLFGKPGGHYYSIVHGEDTRPVNPHRSRKSLGKETTLDKDSDSREQMIAILEELALQVETLVQKNRLYGKTVTLKVKYSDFQSITRSITVETPVVLRTDIVKHIKELLRRTDAGRKKVRLLGITISNFPGKDVKPTNGKQLLLPFLQSSP